MFTDDGRYRRSPYEKSEVGHDAIKAFWLADAGQSFAVKTKPVAIDGQTAVVRLEVSYSDQLSKAARDPAPTTAGSETTSGPTGRASRTQPLSK